MKKRMILNQNAFTQSCRSFLGCYYNAERKTQQKTERTGKRTETENETKVSVENKLYEFR